MAILNNLIVKGDTRFIEKAGGNFTGTFNGFDLQMAAPANASGEDGSEGLISSTDKRDLDKLIARVAGFATTAGAIDSNSRCAAYTATISGIGTTLTAGTVIYIKTHAKSAANATLDVNNIGAKSIYWRTSAVTNDKLGLNYIFMLVYDGSFWRIPYDYDSTYSPVSLGFGYGICSTAKDTAAKTVAISDYYKFVAGGMVAIKFTNGSNVANPTLNINSKGAKPIKFNGEAITLTNDYFVAGLTYLFIYTDLGYELIAVNFDTDYCTCSTAADTAAKTVSVSETFLKVTGAHVTVKFTVTNTASNPTLNVNNTGAAAIYYRGSAISAGYLAANRVYEFVFNGTQYELIGDVNTDTNTDTKVTADPKNDAKGYIIINKGSEQSSTDSVRFNTGIYVEASSSNLHVDGTINGPIPYGQCPTAATTAEKTVSIPGTFANSNNAIPTGARIIVKFNETNSASNPTLNVNGSGAKPIYYRGSTIAAANLVANRTYTFIYNGAQYEVVGDINTDNDIKVTNTLNTTTKYNITGTTSNSTNTNTQIFDTGVYVGNTAGELNSTTYKLNEAVTFEYNSTNQCVDFIFA